MYCTYTQTCTLGIMFVSIYVIWCPGVPCVIVGVSLAVTARNSLFYGLSEMAMLNTNQTNSM